MFLLFSPLLKLCVMHSKARRMNTESVESGVVRTGNKAWLIISDVVSTNLQRHQDVPTLITPGIQKHPEWCYWLSKWQAHIIIVPVTHCHIVQITLEHCSSGGSILAVLRTSETMGSALWAASRAVSEAETCRPQAGLSWTSYIWRHTLQFIQFPSSMQASKPTNVSKCEWNKMCLINSTLLWWFIMKGNLNFQF